MNEDSFLILGPVVQGSHPYISYSEWGTGSWLPLSGPLLTGHRSCVPRRRGGGDHDPGTVVGRKRLCIHPVSTIYPVSVWDPITPSVIKHVYIYKPSGIYNCFKTKFLLQFYLFDGKESWWLNGFFPVRWSFFSNLSCDSLISSREVYLLKPKEVLLVTGTKRKNIHHLGQTRVVPSALERLLGGTLPGVQGILQPVSSDYGTLP